MNNQQLEYVKKTYNDFITFCQMVSKIFEVGKCYQMKIRNKVYLGRENRNYIGFEISKEYCELAEKRLQLNTNLFN